MRAGAGPEMARAGQRVQRRQPGDRGVVEQYVAARAIAAGLAATFASGVGITTVGLPAALGMRRRPEDYGPLPDGNRAAQPQQGTKQPLR